MGRSLFVINSLKFSRYYSNSTNSNHNSETEGIYTSNPLDKDKNMIVYIDVHSLKKKILEENKGKSGIYMFTNKVTKDFYIGQSKNLYNRFLNYFNPSYIRRLKNSIIGRAITKYGYSNFSLTILEYCDKDNLTAREQYYFDTLNPVYNILKVAGAYADSFTHTEETKSKISKALKGVNVGENSYWYGRNKSDETKALMSLKKAGENNPLFGKVHTEETKELMRQKALGRKHSEDTKLLMSSKQGSSVNVYEKTDKEGFKLIGSFVSARRAAKFLDMSGSTVIKYINSGAIFKDRYKFKIK
jgi:group I intron endonuclease